MKTIVNNDVAEQLASADVEKETGWVRTLVVLTWENPIGETLNDADKNERAEFFETVMKNGHYIYFPVTVVHRGKTMSRYIVYNITLSDALWYGEKFSQKSFIYGEMTNGKVMYHLWERGNGDDAFQLNEHVFGVSKIIKEEDGWCCIDDGHKFGLGMIETIDYTGIEDWEKRIDNTLNEGLTAKGRFLHRMQLNRLKKEKDG